MPGYWTETVQRRSQSAPSRGRTQLHLPLRTCWQRRHERQLLLGAYNSWGEAATPFNQTKRTHNRQVIQMSVWWAPGKSVLNASARPVRSVWRRQTMGIKRSFSRSVGKRAVGARNVGVQRPTCRIHASVSIAGVLCPCGAFRAGQPWN